MMEIKLTFSQEVDVKLETGEDGRPTITIKPRYYSAQGLVSLLYVVAKFPDELKRAQEEYALSQGATSGKLRLRAANEEVIPKFMRPAADKGEPKK